MLLTNFIEMSLSARTDREALSVLDEFLTAKGVEVWSYHITLEHLVKLNLEAGFIFHSFDPAWVERYRSRHYYEIDPIIAHSVQASAPYRWWDIGELVELSEAQKAYIADAKAHLTGGYGVPVHGTHGTAAYFGIGAQTRSLDFDMTELAILQLACHQTHARYLQLHGAIETPLPKLTPRETEVLQWVVKGKSNSVIAEVLGISEHTVDTLMRRIYRKFDVTDRTSAALRAVGAGLVSA